MDRDTRLLISPSRTHRSPGRAFLLFRWLLIIVCSTMLLFSEGLWIDLSWAHLFIVLLILSNLSLYFVRDDLLAKSRFYSTIALVDIILITLALILSGQTGTDFYLMYFLVIIISAFSQELNKIIFSTVAVTFIYGLTLLTTSYEKSTADPTILLRFPFFFIIALFYGYVVQTAVQERLRREEVAREEVNRLKAQFLSLITHQLLSPINVIMANVHVLLTGAAGDLSLEQIKVADRLQLQAENLVSLIHDLVDLSKIEAKRITLRIQKAAVKPFLQEIQREVHSLLKDRPLQVELLVDDGVPTVETDWDKLRQAMTHFLASAIKCTPSGQIALIARRAPEQDQVTFAITHPEFEIKKENLPLVFESIKPAVSSPMSESDGFGVTLTLAKNLIEMLGGAVQMNGRHGTSDIAVTIPVLWSQKAREVIEINYS
jgi:signal transduction histidine kinase